MEKYKIDYVCHDDIPYKNIYGDNSDNDVYKYVKSINKFKSIERTDGISTTEIIIRIIRDFSKFVKRNQDRGFTSKDMNLNIIVDKVVKYEIFKSELKTIIEEIKEHLDNNKKKYINYSILFWSLSVYTLSKWVFF